MYPTLERLAFRASLTRKTAAVLLTVAVAAGCAEADEAAESLADASGLGATQADAYVAPTFPTIPTVGNPTIPDSTYNLDASTAEDASYSYPDAEPRPDASVDGSNPFDFGSLFPSGTPDSSVAPGSDGGQATGWTLNSDSAKECPADPPPLPIIGGLCTGIYFMCGWTNDKGQKYSCTCDWIHWLCI